MKKYINEILNNVKTTNKIIDFASIFNQTLVFFELEW